MHECMGFRDISALVRENFVNISLSRRVFDTCEK